MENKSDNIIEQKDVHPEVHIEVLETPSVTNIVINPNDLQNSNTHVGNVPLFIKKLWKIVNDESNRDIISWNEEDNGFILHDQFKFISNTLPRYFKHNQLSSFVRQLNLYGFHKIQNVQKDAFEFGHPFFLKDVPQFLPLIKRKTPTGRQTTTVTTNEPNRNPQPSAEVKELMTAIEDVKTKSDSITNEMSKLRQENAALWGEMNSLRVKYSKQTKVINKLIHFLIAYMQKHHHSRKSGRTVSTSNSNKYLKTGPKIMELDYRYKNNPHDFWTDYDNQQDIPDYNVQEPYTVIEPAETTIENDDTHTAQATEDSPNMRVSSVIEEILPSSNTFNRREESTMTQSIPQRDYSNTQSSSSNSANSALQRTGATQENVGYLIDNSRVEMDTIKELFKNLSSEDMATFYKLVNDNYKIQDDDLSVQSEKELIRLDDMVPSDSLQEYNIHILEKDLGPLNDTNGKPDAVGPALESSILDAFLQQQNSNAPAVEVPPNKVPEPDVASGKMDETSLGLISDDLLNTDDFLHDVSVEQYFNID